MKREAILLAEVRMSDVINPDDVNFYRQIVAVLPQHNNYMVLQIQLADSLPL